MSVSISKNSRLVLSKLLQVDSFQFWDIPDNIAIPPSKDDIQYVVKSNDRIDNISNSFYSTPALWWAIALVNNIDLIPTQLVVGNTLVIPALTSIKSLLSTPR